VRAPPCNPLTIGRAGLLHYTGKALPVFVSSLLPCVFASGLSSVLPYRQLKDNKTAGTSERSKRYRQMLGTLFVTNAVAALSQLCGAMLLAGALLAEGGTGGDLRGGVVLVFLPRRLLYVPNTEQVCTAMQLPCCFAPCLGSLRHWFSLKASQTNETGLKNSQGSGKVLYKSSEIVYTITAC
jgi:hypothetical protein